MTIEIPGFLTSDPIPGVRTFGYTGRGPRSGGVDVTIMLVGQKVSMPASQGSQAAEVIFDIGDEIDAATAAGYGSSIHEMAKVILELCPDARLKGCIANAGVAAVQATKDVVVAGTATSAGAIRGRVAGKAIDVPFAVGDAHTVVSAALEAAIGADIGGAANYTDLPVYASEAAGTVTILSKVKGVDQNQIGFELVVIGTGITLDAGSSTSGVLASGAVAADWDGALDVILDADPNRYWYILLASNDVTSMTTGVDALNARIKAAARADVQKRMRSTVGIAGATPTNALTLSAALEEGTATDETGHRFRAVWGCGQTASPWRIAASWAALETAAYLVRINKNPCSMDGVEIPTLLVPMARDGGPTTQNVKDCLNGGVIPLVYDFDRAKVYARRAITAKHSTGGVTDYRARPINVNNVSDWMLDDLRTYLYDEFGEGWYIADDDPATGRPPTNLSPRTATPWLLERAVEKRLREYESKGYIDSVDALLGALHAERNSTVTSRADVSLSAVVRRWLEQLGVLLNEVGGEA